MTYLLDFICLREEVMFEVMFLRCAFSICFDGSSGPDQLVKVLFLGMQSPTALETSYLESIVNST